MKGPEQRPTFSLNERLKLRREFRRCIQKGERAAGKYIVVFLLPNGLGHLRLGAGSTRRLGNAVHRNRAKRLVREAFRLTKPNLPADTDLVVLPKIPWRDPSLDQLRADLVETACRAAKAADKRNSKGDT